MDRWHPAQLEQRKPVEDFTEDPEEWVFYEDTAVQIKPLQGRELVNAQQAHEKVTHTARIRFQPGINSDMRLKLLSDEENDRILNIAAAINEGEMNRYVILMCSE